MPRYLLLCLLLRLSLVAEAQFGHWMFVQVDSHVSIAFPEAVQEMDIPATLAAANAPNQHDPRAQASRAFRSKDAAAVYSVVIVPFSGKSPVPSDLTSREAYYKNQVVPMLVSRAHGELLAYSSREKNSIPILIIKFRALGAGGNPVVKYMQTFTIGYSIYELFFTPKDGIGESCVAERHRFFDTVVITPQKR